MLDAVLLFMGTLATAGATIAVAVLSRKSARPDANESVKLLQDRLDGWRKHAMGTAERLVEMEAEVNELKTGKVMAEKRIRADEVLMHALTAKIDRLVGYVRQLIREVERLGGDVPAEVREVEADAWKHGS